MVCIGLPAFPSLSTQTTLTRIVGRRYFADPFEPEAQVFEVALFNTSTRREQAVDLVAVKKLVELRR